MEQYLQNATHSLMNIGTTLGQNTWDMRLHEHGADCVTRVRYHSAAMVYDSEDDALAAARYMSDRDAMVLLADFQGTREWSLVNEEGGLLKPLGAKPPDFTTMMAESLRVAKEVAASMPCPTSEYAAVYADRRVS